MIAATTKWRGYGLHNAGQVNAERAHADGQMRSARRAKAHIEAHGPSAFYRVIVEDCVADAHKYRRAARNASHNRTGWPK